MTKAQRLEWIRNASYRDLLQKWRFEPDTSEWFDDDEVGNAFYQAMRARKNALTSAEQVAISKQVGWRNGH